MVVEPPGAEAAEVAEVFEELPDADAEVAEVFEEVTDADAELPETEAEEVPEEEAVAGKYIS